jgi:antitoxin component YwqK of YwqJK toxin-antitoxin module
MSSDDDFDDDYSDVNVVVAPAWIPRRTVDELPLGEFFTFDTVLLVYQLFHPNKAPRDVVWAILRARLAVETGIEFFFGKRYREVYACRDGERHGLETWWHNNGAKWVDRTGRDGKRHGLETDWGEDGTKTLERTWRDGKQHGLETWWHDNGTKSNETMWRDGKLHGLVTWWYENGAKHAELTWRDGKLHGLETLWHDNGTKGSERMWQDGKPR